MGKGEEVKFQNNMMAFKVLIRVIVIVLGLFE